MINNRETFLQE